MRAHGSPSGPARYTRRHGQGLSLLRQGPVVRAEPQPLHGRDRSGASTRTSRRSGCSWARRPSGSTSAPAASRPARSPRPSRPARARGRPCRIPASIRFRAVVEARWRTSSRAARRSTTSTSSPVADGDTGDNMALTLRACLDELDRLATIEDRLDRRDRPRRDRRLGRPRGAARRARQQRGDPLPAHPRRGRGARSRAPASSSTRRSSARRWRAPPSARTPRSASPPRARCSP